MQKTVSYEWIDQRYPRDVNQRIKQIEAEPLPSSTGALLNEAAAESGDRVALHYIPTGEELTYSMLLDRVNKLANGLHKIGIGKGTHVAVMLPNGLEFPITWLALGRIGAVMVPVNISYTGRELDYLVNDADAEFIIMAEQYLPVLDAMAKRPAAIAEDRIVVLGEPRRLQHSWSELLDTGSDLLPTIESVGLNDLCNIQYTSGTTGYPKGCMQEHRYWLTIGKVMSSRDGLRYERLLTSTPFYYMDPQWLVLMTFYQRGTLFMAQKQSASQFTGWLHKYRIHFCQLPGEAVYKQPIKSIDARNEVRRANVSGVRSSVHEDIERRFNLNARESYGMTEIGSGLFVPIDNDNMVGSGSCGRPSPFRECRVVDGELQVRGPGIFLGYYKKPDATKEAIDENGWFRTGDTFQQDEDGWFYIVGRMKDMVRRSSENIPAREVEAVLMSMPEIADAAVLPVPDPMRGEEVKAYVILQSNLTVSDVPPERIVEYARTQLAPFKVPRYIEYRKDLPRTPTNKVRKNILKTEKTDIRLGSWDRVQNRWHDEKLI